MNSTSTTQDQTLTLSIQEDDRIPYQRIDLSKACRVNNTFAISMYQMDYQRLATVLTKKPNQLDNKVLIPVSKVCLDENGFKQLVSELNKLYEVVFGKNQN